MDTTRIPLPPRTARDRITYLFLTKVALHPESGCWEWLGGISKNGYGHFSLKGQRYFAHRYSANLFLGYDLKDQVLCVCHRCDNRKCVNPGHFFLGTRTENMRDCVQKGRLKPKRGEQAGKAKLTDEKVIAARRLFADGMPIRAIARQFKMSNMAMSQVVHRQSWKHVA